jgi:Protein kinase domain
MPEWKVPGYTELRALGSGGFGEVILARHDATGALVAIKYLRHDLLADREFVGMFRSEAEVLASMDDPNIVRLYEYVESLSGAAIVMELINGVALREILAHQGSTTAEAALVVLQGSLMGLAAAHRRGVVHRDYKPENVLVNGEGVSKLTDFGLAARAGDYPIPAGTLRYVAPEQIAGAAASPAAAVTHRPSPTSQPITVQPIALLPTTATPTTIRTSPSPTQTSQPGSSPSPTQTSQSGHPGNPVPAAPSNLTVTAVDPNDIELSWQVNSGDQTGFEISNGVTSTDVGAGSTSYTWAGCRRARTCASRSWRTTAPAIRPGIRTSPPGTCARPRPPPEVRDDRLTQASVRT